MLSRHPIILFRFCRPGKDSKECSIGHFTQKFKQHVYDRRIQATLQRFLSYHQELLASFIWLRLLLELPILIGSRGKFSRSFTNSVNLSSMLDRFVTINTRMHIFSRSLLSSSSNCSSSSSSYSISPNSRAMGGFVASTGGRLLFTESSLDGFNSSVA